MPPETRPPIEEITSAAELRRWYWLKAELVAEARRLGLKTTAGKFVILDRIAHFLETGARDLPGDARPRPTSGFDWQSAPLDRETVITDSYRNSQNVRRFFRAELGDGFRFNRDFMAWMRGNAGKTLADACNAYLALKAEAGAPGYLSEIADHNQFNKYTRDFLADNPGLGMADVRRFWALKIAQPSETGRHIYERSDLALGDGWRPDKRRA